MASMDTVYNALPISKIIGAPILAACDAQIMLAKSTEQFVREVGFSGTDPETNNLKTRMVDFSFTRPVQDRDGNIVEEKVDLQVPMLAVVNVPNLSIKSMDVLFDMEIKSLESSKELEDKNKKDNGGETKQTGEGVQIFGKVATHRENTRNTDTSSKYHIEIHAERDTVPEGLSRVLDIIASSVAPRKAEALNTKKTQDTDSNHSASIPAAQPDNSTRQQELP